MASVLTIAGSTVNRPAKRVILNRLHRSLDEYDVLEFSQIGMILPGDWHRGQAVTLTIDGTQRFSGQIVSVHHAQAATGWTIGYRCFGLKYQANLVPVTNPNDLTGLIAFNLPIADPLYNPTLAGQSVGQILSYLITGHAAALIAAGIGTTTSPSFDGYTASDLTPLTIVPPEPVYFTGPRLMTELDRFLERWSGKYALFIDPNGPVTGGTTTGKIRVVDTTSLTPVTLTLGTDPVEWPTVNSDTSECATRVVVRGQGEIEPAEVSYAQGTLAKGWSGGDESAWSWPDFALPGTGNDTGNVTAVASTTVTIQSDNGSLTWAANFWSGIQGQIALINPAATGITQTEYRNVTACGSLSAGGTCTITLDRALANGGYTRYQLVGRPTGTRADVWRRYTPTSTWIKAHLALAFADGHPATFFSANEAIQVMYPTAEIFSGSIGFPAKFNIDQTNGDVVFAEPVVKCLNTQADLNTGGGSVTAPTDVLVLLAYSRGTLTATEPADVGGVPQYDGTAYTADGIQRTYYFDVPAWNYKGDLSNMLLLAQMILDTNKNTIYEGSIKYNGKLSSVLGLGNCLDIAGNGYTTGWESMAAAIRGVTLEWPQGGSPNKWETTLTFSNRRKQATGVELYIHPGFAGGGLGQSGGLSPFGASLLGGMMGMGLMAPPPGISAFDQPDEYDPGAIMGELGAQAGAGFDMMGGQAAIDDAARAATNAARGTSRAPGANAFVDVGAGPRGEVQPVTPATAAGQLAEVPDVEIPIYASPLDALEEGK